MLSQLPIHKIHDKSMHDILADIISNHPNQYPQTKCTTSLDNIPSHRANSLRFYAVVWFCDWDGCLSQWTVDNPGPAIAYPSTDAFRMYYMIYQSHDPDRSLQSNFLFSMRYQFSPILLLNVRNERKRRKKREYFVSIGFHSSKIYASVVTCNISLLYGERLLCVNACKGRLISIFNKSLKFTTGKLFLCGSIFFWNLFIAKTFCLIFNVLGNWFNWRILVERSIYH